MSPEVLEVDENGRKEDADAIHEAIYAGVHLFTTAHGSSIGEVRKRPILRDLIEEGVFERIVLLSRRSGPGTIEAVYDGKCHPLRSTLCSS
jgi:stage III sporulation protein AA